MVLIDTPSEWFPVLNRVPWGSLLFLLCRKDIDEGVQSLLFKFADDNKILKPITAANEHQILKKNLGEMTNEIQRL